jgi:endonuclease YncB( thermonuclease family)
MGDALLLSGNGYSSRAAPSATVRGGSVNDFCPQCGTARVGAFRFCRGCRFDFDTPTAPPGTPPPTVPVAEPVGSTLVAAGNSGLRLSGRGMLGAGLALAVGLAGISSLQATETGSRTIAEATGTPTARVLAAATGTPTVTASPTPGSTFGPTGQTTEATVVRVVDGDTIVVAYGGTQYKVRYIGMNTPETVDPSSPVEWMGPQASTANKTLVAGKAVVLEKDVSETDRYGLLLRYVWLTDGVSWTLVNLELVKQGFASVATYPPDVKYVDIYLAAERDAQATAVGLWGATPTAQPTLDQTTEPTPTDPLLTPDPTPDPTPKASKCHPSYDPCLPIVADLDCSDVRAMGKAPVTVKGPDDYRLDRDGDGIGCE